MSKKRTQPPPKPTDRVLRSKTAKSTLLPPPPPPSAPPSSLATPDSVRAAQPSSPLSRVGNLVPSPPPSSPSSLPGSYPSSQLNSPSLIASLNASPAQPTSRSLPSLPTPPLSTASTSSVAAPLTRHTTPTPHTPPKAPASATTSSSTLSTPASSTATSSAPATSTAATSSPSTAPSTSTSSAAVSPPASSTAVTSSTAVLPPASSTAASSSSTVPTSSTAPAAPPPPILPLTTPASSTPASSSAPALSTTASSTTASSSAPASSTATSSSVSALSTAVSSATASSSTTAPASSAAAPPPPVLPLNTPAAPPPPASTLIASALPPRTMSSSGLAKLPAARSEQAPRFTNQASERISDFLREYEALTTGLGLSDAEKVANITRYTSSQLADFWVFLDGYDTGDWTTFHEELNSLYRRTRSANRRTKDDLQEFTKLSAQNRIADEDDLITYHRRFLQFSKPLIAAKQLSDEDQNVEFFRGFHQQDRNIIKNRLYTMDKTRIQSDAPTFADTLEAARSYFSNDHFHRPVLQVPDDNNNLDAHPPWTAGSSQKQDPDHPMPRPEYTTKTVRFHDSKTPPEEDDLEDLIRKMHKLTTRDETYAVLYAQCKQRFPELAQELRKPEMFQTAAFSLQTTANSSWLQPTASAAPPAPAAAPIHQPWQQPQHPPLAPAAGPFFQRLPRSPGCAFCSQIGHMIRGCPGAEHYVNTGRAIIREMRLYLPNGQYIPNDGSNRGLKHGIDTWIAANTTLAPDTLPPAATPTPPIAFQRDAPPHQSLSFEAIHSEVHMAQITDAPDTEAPEDLIDDDDNLSSDLFDLYDVLITEKRKRDSYPTKPQDAPPSAPANAAPANAAPANAAPANAAPARPAFNASHSTARSAPQYRYQSNAEDQKLTSELSSWLLDGQLARTTPAHILAASPPIRKDLADKLRTRRVEAAAFAIPSPLATPTPLGPSIEPAYSLPLQEIDVLVGGLTTEAGVIDPGSQIVAIRKDLADEVSARINTGVRLEMEGANSATNWTLGCAENLQMQIGKVPFSVHAHVVQNAPFRLLLGRPFQQLLLCSLEDKPNGRVDITICDPRKRDQRISVPSRERRVHVGYMRALTYQLVPAAPPTIRLEQHAAIQQGPQHGLFTSNLAYKKVANKVHPVAASLPEDFRIIRRRPEDPLLSLPPLPTHAPPFSPGSRLTQERLDDLELNRYKFLWPEELRLAQHVLKLNETALAWTEAERGRFRDDYFTPVKIPTIAHTPWVQRNIPIPTGIMDNVIDLFKEKIAAGVYEPSDASYRSRWFCVKKKNGSLRIVHDLQPLNAVTIRNAAVPPFVDQFVEGMAARACYSMLDLFVGYDHRSLDVASRDLTTFQSPLGAFRCTVLPQGSTNAVAIFHGDVTFLLEPEMPHVAKPFLDDTAIRGPTSRFETPDGGYEVIPSNDGIRRFIWEHLNDVHRILHRLGHAGATVSAPKLFLAAPEVVILGHKCTYGGRIPEDSKTAKVQSWPQCKNVSDVRAFLGTAGTMRIWIKNYSAIARPLVDLTRKGIDFTWREEHDHAMQQLKNAIASSSALIPIDYISSRPVFLAIDSSYRAVGWILSQECEDGQRRHSRFGSIAWNERESRYSQPKIELYGLFRTLRALRIHIVGVTNLVVEMDAKFVKGMLSNPDVQPNAAMNRWIAAILLFNFTLAHVPAEKHTGPDGLSRREPIPGEDEKEGDPEEWIDNILALGIWIDTWPLSTLPSSHATLPPLLPSLTSNRPTIATFATTRARARAAAATAKTTPPPPDSLSTPPAPALTEPTTPAPLPPTNSSSSPALPPSSPTSESTPHDPSTPYDDLEQIHAFLDNSARLSNVPPPEREKIVKRARRFFVHNGRLWRRQVQGRHQLVLNPVQHDKVLREAHDDLGHKGYYATLRTLLDRFWWPSLANDIKQYITTCHECQLRQTTKVHIPPTVAVPAPLFRKAYIDTMFMPPAAGFRYIVQARCSLSAWPEWRALRVETARTLAAFVFEDILCRWGAVGEIVTDNGTAFVAALDYLADRYGIRHIRISAYNSRANGIVERQHRTIRESIVKACEGDISKWPAVAPHAFWADRATTRKSTGHTPFYMAHGIEPILPFDITLATFLVPDIAKPLTTADLLAIRTRQLQKRPDDLAAIHTHILKSRFDSVRQFERTYENTIRDYNFLPGALVLVRNSSIETDLGRKSKPRYVGPMLVVRRSTNGAYRLAELDGAVSKLRFAAFRLVPYHARSRTSIPVTRIVEREHLTNIYLDVDLEDAIPDPGDGARSDDSDT